MGFTEQDRAEARKIVSNTMLVSFNADRYIKWDIL